MSYEKQTWVDGTTPLDAEHLNHMEAGIASAVQTTSQTLPEEQKSQARTNIDALSAADVYTVLQQAKDSGQFDGPAGPQGDKGDAGPQGPAYTLNDIDKNTIAAAVKASLTKESWTFTLEDGSTVTKAVYVG